MKLISKFRPKRNPLDSLTLAISAIYPAEKTQIVSCRNNDILGES